MDIEHGSLQYGTVGRLKLVECYCLLSPLRLSHYLCSATDCLTDRESLLSEGQSGWIRGWLYG